MDVSVDVGTGQNNFGTGWLNAEWLCGKNASVQFVASSLINALVKHSGKHSTDTDA